MIALTKTFGRFGNSKDFRVRVHQGGSTAVITLTLIRIPVCCCVRNPKHMTDLPGTSHRCTATPHYCSGSPVSACRPCKAANPYTRDSGPKSAQCWVFYNTPPVAPPCKSPIFFFRTTLNTQSRFSRDLKPVPFRFQT